MRKLFTLKTFMLLLVTLVSVGAWADEKSYTISFKDSGNTSDGSTAYGAGTSNLSAVFTSTDYVSAVTSSSSVYPARTGRGAKFGTSSKAGSIVIALTDAGKVTAKRIEIVGGAYISSSKAEKAAVKVNGGTAVAFDQTVTSYTEETITYTFSTPTAIESISLAQNTASGGRMYIKSITVYYDESDSNLEYASWSLTPSSVSVYKNESCVLDLTTNYDGTLTFTSANEAIATVSYNSETKKITVNGVSNGSTKINVTGSATSTYNAISKTIDVTVSVKENQFNKTITSSGWGYDYFELTPEGSNVYAQPDVTTTTKVVGDLTIDINRNGSSASKPRYDVSYLRFYKGNSITFTVPVGCNITSFTLVEPTSGKAWAGTMEVTTGAYDENTKKWIASDDVNSVTITGVGDTKRIGGVIVNVYKDGYISTLTIGAVGYTTYYNSAEAYTMPEGCVGSVWTVADGLETAYEAGDVVPAGEPLVISSEEAGDYDLMSGNSSEETYKSADMNDLDGTDAETALEADASAYFYGLSLNAEGELSSVGFYWMAEDGAAFTNGAHKAYLKLAKAQNANVRSFRFSAPEETGITNVNAAEKANVIYNLAGQRVSANAKGLVIVNGKKFANK